MKLHQFFSVSGSSQQQQQHRSSVSHSSYNGLLSGPPRSGKSSLLLQFAYNNAVEESATVIFLCKPHNFDYSPPFLAQDVDPASQVWERVCLKYVNDDEGLRKFFAAFHLQSMLPRAVIVDDYSSFFNTWKNFKESSKSRAREKAMVKTLATCHDAINYANDRSPSAMPCKLLISDTHTGDEPKLLYIYRRWLTNIFVIKALDSATFILSSNTGSDKEAGGPRAEYTIEQYLNLVSLH